MNRIKQYLKPFKRIYAGLLAVLMTWNLRKLVRNMSILAVIVGIVGGYLWFSRMYTTDERRFWIAVENSLSTQSVTRTLVNGGSGNKVVQDQQFFFSPQMASKSHVSFVQKNATTDTAVETEGVSYPDKQYSRYTAFRTNQQKEDGSIPSLDSVLGKWEGDLVKDEDKEQARLQYVSELVTLAVFGNYDAKFRKELLSELKTNGTYEINKAGITLDEKDGRKTIIVPVKVKLKNYTSLLQKAFMKAGYGEFPALNPENYREDATINATFAIDYKSNSISGIQFGTRQESYSSYGINTTVVTPETTFTDGGLENFVQQEIGSVF